MRQCGIVTLTCVHMDHSINELTCICVFRFCIYLVFLIIIMESVAKADRESFYLL